MNRVRILGIIFLSALFLPFLFGQGQQAESRSEAQKMLKSIGQKLDVRKPSNEILDSLKALESIADELHERMHSRAADMLRHRDAAVRRHALITLGAIGVTPDSARSVVTNLTMGLRDPDPENRSLALWALRRLGPYSKPALPKAIEAVKDLDPRVRRGAIAMIGIHVPEDKDLIPVLVAALDDPDLGADKNLLGVDSVSYLAMETLSECKTDVKDAVPKLITIINTKKDDDAARWRALLAMGSIAPEHPVPLKVARQWLSHKDSPPDLVKACKLLSSMGVHAKDAVPDLIAVAKLKPFPDKNSELSVKLAVLQSFRRIGPAARDALPTLEELAKSDNQSLRSHIREAIKAVQEIK